MFFLYLFLSFYSSFFTCSPFSFFFFFFLFFFSVDYVFGHVFKCWCGILPYCDFKRFFCKTLINPLKAHCMACFKADVIVRKIWNGRQTLFCIFFPSFLFFFHSFFSFPFFLSLFFLYKCVDDQFLLLYSFIILFFFFVFS